MRIKASASFLSAALPKPWPDEVQQLLRYDTGSRLVRVPLHVFPDDAIEQIQKACLKSTEPSIKRLAKKIDDYKALNANPTGEGVGKLERLVVALTSYIRRSPNKIVFFESADGQTLPYYVTSIRYIPREKGRDGTDAHVVMNCKAICRGSESGRTVTFWKNSLQGKPRVSRLLNAHGAYLETPEAYAAYLKELALYNGLREKLGSQWLGDGYTHSGDALLRDGAPTRLVLDDECNKETDSEADGLDDDNGICSTLFWLDAKKKQKVEASDDEDDENPEAKDEDDESEEEESYVTAAPVHPYVQMFDLERHEFIRVHVNCFKPYVYQEGLDEKLVLPDEHRELINILVAGAADVMEDIVAGKTGGVVVACTGEPGTGKTLTAEVCSEHIKKPLYMVQCAQLGTDEEEIEKKLQLVLRRASRWGALLLIDEADVYVRERGTDIQQNAIVGVFLRLLERYRGVLFLTSNRATTIDDAVMSRCIAHVKYGPPSNTDLARIWRIMADNYKAELKDTDIAKLVFKFPGISGRNVKTLLKLATMVSKRKKQPVSYESILSISAFVEMLKAS